MVFCNFKASIPLFPFVIISGSYFLENSYCEDYQKLLYDLGALPISKMDSTKFQYAINDTAFYSKSGRVDFRGWISPTDVNRSNFFTPELKLKYGIPKEIKDYKKYYQLLDPSKIRKSTNRLHRVVVYFVIENMYYKIFPVSDSLIINLLKADLALHETTVREILYILSGRMNGLEIIDLYNSVKDIRILSILPEPKKHQREYIQALEVLHTKIDSEVKKWELIYLLYNYSPTPYSTLLKSTAMRAVNSCSHWYVRGKIYCSLVKISDQTAIEKLVKALKHDSSTSTRIQIIECIKRAKTVNNSIANAFIDILKGEGSYHKETSLSRRPFAWEFTLLEFAKFISEEGDQVNIDIKNKLNDLIKHPDMQERIYKKHPY